MNKNSNIENKFDIIIVGAGASGLMAAVSALAVNKKVLLLEKNEKAGKKIYITGKGRCNITNNKDLSINHNIKTSVPTSNKEFEETKQMKI